MPCAPLPVAGDLAPLMGLAMILMLIALLIWATNLYNFMDGADGLAGGMAVFGFTAYGWAALESAPELAWESMVLAAASAGFLPFNFAPSKIFLGDGGAIPIGFLAGAFGLIG